MPKARPAPKDDHVDVEARAQPALLGLRFQDPTFFKVGRTRALLNFSNLHQPVRRAQLGERGVDHRPSAAEVVKEADELVSTHAS